VAYQNGDTKLASARRIAWMKQVCAEAISTPIPASAAHCSAVGICQNAKAAALAMQVPMKLLTSRIWNAPSRPESRLITTSSAPRQSAAPSARSDAGWNACGVGRSRIIAPTSAITAAETRTRPIFSPRKGMASSIPTTGLRKLIAVASESGMKAAAANMKLTPPQPNSTRSVCTGSAGRVILGRISSAAVENIVSAKMNRPWLICSGCSAGPSVSVPSILASSVVPAMKPEASRVRAAASGGFGRASMPAGLRAWRGFGKRRAWCRARPARVSRLRRPLDRGGESLYPACHDSGSRPRRPRASA